MISLSCPACQKSYRLDDKFSGKKVRCKSCSEVFRAESSTDDFGEDDAPIEPKPVPAQKPTAKLRAKPAVEAENPFADDDLFRSDGESLQELPPLPKPKPRAKVKDSAIKERSPKRRISSSSGSFLGGHFGAIISGTVGGAIGAAIWGAITYFTHHEVGYVAWGIGGLVGFCVRLAADDVGDGLAGVIAATLSVVSILAGKFIAAILIVNWLMQQANAPQVLANEIYWSVVFIGFKASFGAFDIVFFLLAIATAYRLGSGNEED